MLGAHLPHGALNVYDGRRTKKAFLVAVALLRNGGVQTNDGRHWHHTRGIVRDMVAYDTANLGMRVWGVFVVQLALAGRRRRAFVRVGVVVGAGVGRRVDRIQDSGVHEGGMEGVEKVAAHSDGVGEENIERQVSPIAPESPERTPEAAQLIINILKQNCE